VTEKLVVFAYRCSSCKVLLTALDDATDNERWRRTRDGYEHKCSRRFGRERFYPAVRVQVALDRDRDMPPPAAG
jgi:hypothetical protein